ncbi:hypothetical protein [Geobacillus subterraneus]
MERKANNKRSDKSVRTADARTAGGRASMREQAVQDAYKTREEVTAD